MKNKKLNNIIDQLVNDQCPDELNFGVDKPVTNIDIEKVKYNSFFRSFEFYENKFPSGYENIPGFDKIIVQLSVSANENEITPLKELEERQKEAETKQNL
jgi:hypothetical protein